jgi:hypothetical protein
VNEKIKKIVMLGLAVVAFVAAGVLLMTRSSSEAKYPTSFVTNAVDLVDKSEAKLSLAMGELLPYKNPKTGQKTMFPWYYCPECNKRFVPPPTKRADGIVALPMIPTCPLCDSRACSVWNPADPEQAKPAGDAPLPKMPT